MSLLVQVGDRGPVLPVPHGADPRRVVEDAGYLVIGPSGAATTKDGAVLVRYAAQPTGQPEREHVPAPAQKRDADLQLEPGEEPAVHQRVGAYAVVLARVEGTPSLLFTQMSGRTNAEGWWGLAGGGVEPGEQPASGAVREVMEETGQAVRVGGLVYVGSDHWVGRAPHGRVEDFHAVRLVFSARCLAPGTPRVQEDDSTTAAAAWVPLTGLADLPVLASTRDALKAVGLGSHLGPEQA